MDWPSAKEMTSETSPVFNTTYTQAPRTIIAAIEFKPNIARTLCEAQNATSALDTITQSEILHLFAQLNRELGMGILYISHDLLSVAALCHRIAILNAGQILECGPPAQIFGAPQHAYTQKLVAALPRGPFLDFRGDNLGNPIARDEKSGCSKQSEESSIPDQIPSIAR
jgi:ABC-type dipeptide/oligopeptide/nickel transport system ATPase component